MSPPLSIYLALTSVAAPVARLVLRLRVTTGKEDAARLGERLGQASRPRPDGPLLWFHGASVGESLSMLPLIAGITNERSDLSVLVTSGTVTSAKLLSERLPPHAIHQFVPIDAEPGVSSFLDHWKPDLAVFIESEIWPRLLWSLGKRGITALLLNARLSKRSRNAWRRFPRTASELFGVFAEIHAQDDSTAAMLRHLGISMGRVQVTGSLKTAAAPLPCDDVELQRLRGDLTGRLIWLAASTHPGEEALAVAAHRNLVVSHPDALLIIVPRHPDRGREIASLLEASGQSWSQRANGPPRGVTSIYLADTLGELGLWYRLSDVAYVGGSAGGLGGHNPYEPVALDVPVLHGPDTSNFASIYRELDDAGAAMPVETPEQLARAVSDCAGTKLGAAMIARADSVVGRDFGAFERAVEAILIRLPAPD